MEGGDGGTKTEIEKTFGTRLLVQAKVHRVYFVYIDNKSRRLFVCLFD